MAKGWMTTEQQLLIATRKGDFGALAALIDLLRERDEAVVAKTWDTAIANLRYRMAHPGRWRISVAEDARRWMKFILRDINKRCRARWSLPPMRSFMWRKEPLFSQVCELRTGMIAMIRARMDAEARNKE